MVKPLKALNKIFGSEDRDFKRSLKFLLGFKPKNLKLYRLAFTHRSGSKLLSNGIKLSNERLEFLGDAVLSSISAEIVFKNFSEKDEGFLTEMRSKMVNRLFLNQIAGNLNIIHLLDYDKKVFPGSIPSGSVLGDAFEALIGAIFLDQGFKKAQSFYTQKILTPFIDLNKLSESQINFKSKLIEWGQRTGKEIQFMQLPMDPENNLRLFTVKVLIGGEELGMGKDFNKKMAEKIAAENACKLLKI